MLETAEQETMYTTVMQFSSTRLPTLNTLHVIFSDQDEINEDSLSSLHKLIDFFACYGVSRCWWNRELTFYTEVHV